MLHDIWCRYIIIISYYLIITIIIDQVKSQNHDTCYFANTVIIVTVAIFTDINAIIVMVAIIKFKR